ncbi:MAG: threonine synthase [Acidimicrobiia bacterium]|nr:threonine synthase [Acidimicrobiia bacterium]
MTGLPVRHCSGCAAVVADPKVFACPHAHPGDDIDHVLVSPEPSGPWPDGAPGDPADEANPFVRYRQLSWTWALAQAAGLGDDRYVQLVAALDDDVATIDRRDHGFVASPLRSEPALAKALGLPTGTTLLAKDETGNVSGSHKARHLMGLMIHLLLLERLGLLRNRPHLAIASCGNAALGAAVVAAAANWPLQVFVPPEANPAVLHRLGNLEAQVELCARRASQAGEAGDPCYLRFRAAVRAGAIPFATQGPENGLAIDGGATLGYELADQLVAEGRPAPDRLYVQVGGGALAAATVAGLRTAVRLGRLDRQPRLVAVQTTGAFPLVRAYERALVRLPHPMALSEPEISSLLSRLARRRSEVMWPWEEQPRSLATGILDDETYDWRAVLEGILRSRGRAVAVGEPEIAQAHRLVHEHTRTDADPTGTAGVAGLLSEVNTDTPGIGPGGSGQVVVVLLTGVTRR